MSMTKKEIRLHKAAAKYIMGESFNIKIKGKNAKIKCLSELLSVSKELKEKLEEGTDIDSIAKLLDKKRNLSIDFENLSGIKWRL